MNPNELKNYRPYSAVRSKNTDYVEITFQNENFLTVPRNSEQTIVKILNDAFQNGVRTALSNFSEPFGNSSGSGTRGVSGYSGSTFTTTPAPTVTKQPVEDLEPINSYTKRKK